MNAKKMLLSLIPWALFTVMIERRGEHGAAIAAAAAAGVALWIGIKDSKDTSFKIIDGAGVVTFAALAVAAFAGGDNTSRWVADYGRGTATFALAAVMLGSAVTLPFTEQYARETVPREYWHSPVFRAVNRRISAVWGTTVAVIALGHILAGLIDPATAPKSGTRPVDLFLNWVVPIALVLFAISYTNRAADSAGSQSRSPAPPPAHSARVKSPVRK